MKKLFNKGLALALSVILAMGCFSAMSGTVVFGDTAMTRDDYFTAKPTEELDLKVSEYTSEDDFNNGFKSKAKIVEPYDGASTSVEYANSVGDESVSAVKFVETHAAYHGLVYFPNPDGDYNVKTVKGKYYMTPSNAFWSRFSADYLILGYNKGENVKKYNGAGLAICYTEQDSNGKAIGTRILERRMASPLTLDETTGKFNNNNYAAGTWNQPEYNSNVNVVATLNNQELTDFLSTYQYTTADRLVNYTVTWEYSTSKQLYTATVKYDFNIGGKQFSYTVGGMTFEVPVFGFNSCNSIANNLYVSDTKITYDVDSYRQKAADKFMDYFNGRSDKNSAQWQSDYNSAFADVKAADQKVADLIEAQTLKTKFEETVTAVGDAYDAGDLSKLESFVNDYNNASDGIKEALKTSLSGKLTGLMKAYKAIKNGAAFYDDFEGKLNWKVDHKITDDSLVNWRAATDADFKYTAVSGIDAMFNKCGSSETLASDGVLYYTKNGSNYTLVTSPSASEIGTYYKAKFSFTKQTASSKLNNRALYYTKSGNTYTFVANPVQADIASYYTYSGTRYFTKDGENYKLDTAPDVANADKYYTVSGKYDYIYDKDFVTGDKKTFALSTADSYGKKVMSPNVSELDNYLVYIGEYADYYDNLTETHAYTSAGCTAEGDDGKAFWGIYEDTTDSGNKSLWLRKAFNAKNTNPVLGDTVGKSVQGKPSVMYTTSDGILNSDQYIYSYSGKMYFGNLHSPWDRYKYAIGAVYSYDSETKWAAIGLNGAGAMQNISRTSETAGKINDGFGVGSLLDNATQTAGDDARFYRGQWIDFSIEYDFSKGYYVYTLKGLKNASTDPDGRGADSTTNIKGEETTKVFDIKGATKLLKKIGLVNGGMTSNSFDDISVSIVNAKFVVSKIASLPALDDLTVGDRDLVLSVKQIYDLLTDEEKDNVTNYAVLQAALQRIDDLLSARDKALDLTDYSSLTFEDGGYTAVSNPQNSLITSYYETSEYRKTNDISIVSGKDYYTRNGNTFTKVTSPDVAKISTYYEKTPGYIKTADTEVQTGKTYYVLQKGVEYLDLENGANRKAHSVVDNPYKEGLNTSDMVLKITSNKDSNGNYAVYNIKPEATGNNGMLGYYTGKFYLTTGNRYENPPIVVYDYKDNDNWKGIAFYVENGEYGFHRVDIVNGKNQGVSNAHKVGWGKNRFFTNKEYSTLKTTAGWVEFYVQYSLTKITLNVSIINKDGQKDIFTPYEHYTLQETCATGVGVATFSGSGAYFDDLKVGMYESDDYTAAKSFLNKNSYITKSYPYALYMSSTDKTEIDAYKDGYAALGRNNPKAINYLTFVPTTIEVLDAAYDWATHNNNASFANARDEEMLKKVKETNDSIVASGGTYYVEANGTYTKVTNPDSSALSSYYVKNTEYNKTADTAVQADKEYYVLSGSSYNKVTNPVDADIASYYEKKEVYKPAVYSNFKFSDDLLHGLSMWRTDERNKGQVKIVEDETFAKLTSDKQIVEGKTYYTKSSTPFSKVTEDTAVVEGKHYYEKNDDGEFVYVENPVDADISKYYDSPYTKVTNPVAADLGKYYEDVEVASLNSFTSITPKSKFLPEKAHLQHLSYRVRVTQEPQWFASLRIYTNWVNVNNYSGISFVYTKDSSFVETKQVTQTGIGYGPQEELNVMNVLTVNIDYQSNGFYTLTIKDEKKGEILRTGTANLKAIMKICAWGMTAHYADITAYYDYGLYDDDVETSDIITYYTGNTYTNPGDIAIIYGDSIGSTVSSVQVMQLNNTNPNSLGYINRQAFDFEGVQEDEFSTDPTVVNNVAYWSAKGIDWNSVNAVKIQQKAKDSVKFIMPSAFTNGIYVAKVNGMNIAENENDFKIVYFNSPYFDYSIGMDGETSAPGEDVRLIGKNLAPNTEWKTEKDYSSFVDNGVKVKLKKVEFNKTTDSAVDNNKTYYVKEMSYEELDTVNREVMKNNYYEYDSATKTYKLTADSKPVSGKTYYKGTAEYVRVDSPSDADLSKYYVRNKSVPTLDAKVTNIYSDYALSFEVPDEVEVPSNGNAVDYEVYVYNGYGDDTAWTVPYITKFAKDMRSTWSDYTINIRDYLDGADFCNGRNAATYGFVNALSELADNGGGILYIPKGVYRITQPLIVPENVQIVGNSKEDTELIFSPYQWDVNELPLGLFKYSDNIAISNISIQGSRAGGIFAGFSNSTDNIYLENIYLWFSPNGGAPSDAPNGFTGLGDYKTLWQTEKKPSLFSVATAGDNINIINVDGMDDNIGHRPLVNDLWGSKYFRIENSNFHNGWSEYCANYGWVFGNTFQNACIGIWGHGTYLQDNHLCDLQANNRELYVADRAANYDGKIVQYSDDKDNVKFKLVGGGSLRPYLFDHSQLYVRSGQGESQTRTITSYDENTGWFTVDRPFTIAPNRNSSVIMRRTRENIFFVNNYYENGGAGGFYGGVADVVYDGNVRDRNIGFYMESIFNDVNWYYSVINETYVYNPMSSTNTGVPSIEAGYTWEALSGYNASMCGTMRNNEINGMRFENRVANGLSDYSFHDIIIDNNRFNDITENAAITSTSGQDRYDYRDGFIEYRNTYHNVKAKYGGVLESNNIVANAKKSVNSVGGKRWVYLESEEEDYFNTLPYGDVDGDGKVTLKDAILVRNYLIGRNTLTGDQLKRADVDGDGNVTLMDANDIKYKVVGIITTFKAEQP